MAANAPATGTPGPASPGPAAPPGLAGQRALVTGGSRGIGRAIVERFAARGVAVVFTYTRSKDAALHIVADVAAAGGRAHAVQADLADLADLRRVFDETLRLLGGVDVLVNNAAESLVAPIADTSEQVYDRLMAVNTKAIFFAIQHATRVLSDGGRIINLSSVNTVRHAPGIAVYAASKAAVEQFTLVAARELAPRGITVNTVSPGPTDTDMLRNANSPQALDLAAAMTPLRRLGQPADVADVVCFLAGPQARWVTGENVRVSGGFG
ncbi:MAG TPA: glucose 1-dehydrogenase [Streptosporangiaceae bacterium]